jgi:hypothetical protein
MVGNSGGNSGGDCLAGVKTSCFAFLRQFGMTAENNSDGSPNDANGDRGRNKGDGRDDSPGALKNLERAMAGMTVQVN